MDRVSSSAARAALPEPVLTEEDIKRFKEVLGIYNRAIRFMEEHTILPPPFNPETTAKIDFITARVSGTDLQEHVLNHRKKAFEQKKQEVAEANEVRKHALPELVAFFSRQKMIKEDEALAKRLAAESAEPVAIEDTSGDLALATRLQAELNAEEAAGTLPPAEIHTTRRDDEGSAPPPLPRTASEEELFSLEAQAIQAPKPEGRLESPKDKECSVV